MKKKKNYVKINESYGKKSRENKIIMRERERESWERIYNNHV